MLTAMDVARYFVAKNDEEAGESVSNLKLQKLLYYAQGVHLALTGQPLFREAVMAWQHGPVVESVYHSLKEFGSGPVEFEGDLDFDQFDGATRDILDEVYDVYGQFSAWKLRNMTHDEPPWRDTPAGALIPNKRLKEYFETRIRTDGQESEA